MCVCVCFPWTQGPVHGPVWRSVLRHGGEESLSDCDAWKEHCRAGDGLPHRGLPDAVWNSLSERWGDVARSQPVPWNDVVADFVHFFFVLLPDFQEPYAVMVLLEKDLVLIDLGQIG